MGQLGDGTYEYRTVNERKQGLTRETVWAFSNPMTVRRFTRSRSNKVLAGVCGGLARYFNWDPTLVRVLWVVGALLTGVLVGLVAYIIFWAVFPQE